MEKEPCYKILCTENGAYIIGLNPKKEKKMRTNQYIIGSLSSNDTHVSLSVTPHPHDDKGTAGREAERLARTNPGKRYVVLKIEGIVEVQSLVWS